MPYVLDTDTISALERGDRGAVARKQIVPPSDVFVTIVSMQEQVAGRLSVLARPLTRAKLIEAYQRFSQVLDFYASAKVLPYDDVAAQVDDTLRTTLPRMARNDRRIAAMTLAHQATLVTGNTKDYRGVLGLVLEDWISG